MKVESWNRSHTNARCSLPMRSTLDLRPSTRRAFTLVEMLVVIVIMLILLVMTVTAVNFGMDAERIRGAARQLQSYIAGARDRGIYKKRPVGVRFLLDESIPRAVSSVVFVQKGQEIRAGKVFVKETAPGNGNFRRVAFMPEVFVRDPQKRLDNKIYTSDWWLLRQKQMLVPGSKIRIPDNGLAYVVQSVVKYNSEDARGADRRPGVANKDDDGDGPPYPQNRDELDELGWPGSDDPWVELTVGFWGSPDTQGLSYRLDLPATVMPNQEPTLLSRGIVIDLDRSRIPSQWRLGGNSYTSRMDIMFSPGGTVIGTAGATGRIHLLLCNAAAKMFLDDLVTPVSPSPLLYVRKLRNWQKGKVVGPPILSDAALDTTPAAIALQKNVFSMAVPQSVLRVLGDALVVTVFPATGAISTHPVDRTDADGDGLADDPFRFAETGEVAQQ